eukprot:Em0006g1342a
MLFSKQLCATPSISTSPMIILRGLKLFFRKLLPYGPTAVTNLLQKIAVSLRLGLAFCKPLTVVGISNSITISRSDGKRPDGATLVPWKCGKLLVWDATCVDTYAPSYSRVASQEAGAVADQAEKQKSDKYSNMDPNMYLFAPVVIETSGVFGKQTLSFLKDLACRVRKVSGEVKSFPYLLQRLAVAVQRGVAPNNDTTWQLLQAKHPKGPPPVCPPNDTSNFPSILPNTFDILSVLRSFTKSTACGPSGLRVQHLLDATEVPMQSSICSSLRSIVNLLATGSVSNVVSKFLAGGNLTALTKDKPVKKSIVHGLRSGIEEHQNEQDFVVMKIDLRNAFNLVSRQALLDEFPELLQLAAWCYGQHPLLWSPMGTIMSESGVQQGDPLGPLLFCLVLQKVLSAIASDPNCFDLLFHAWYIDDGVIAGPKQAVVQVLSIIQDLGPPLGLVINSSKCELYGDCDLQPFPSEMKKCNAFNFEILGAPIGDTIFCAKFIAEKRAGASKFLALLKEVGSLDSQVALVLLTQSVQSWVGQELPTNGSDEGIVKLAICFSQDLTLVAGRGNGIVAGHQMGEVVMSFLIPPITVCLHIKWDTNPPQLNTAATCIMSASLIAPKDVNRSSMHSSWAPGVGGGGTSSRKGERSFNTSLQATAGGAKAQLESSGIEKSFKQRKSFEVVAIMRCNGIAGFLWCIHITTRLCEDVVMRMLRKIV